MVCSATNIVYLDQRLGYIEVLEKNKITKILNSEENQFGKSIITWQNQITKPIKNEWTRGVGSLTLEIGLIFSYKINSL